MWDIGFVGSIETVGKGMLAILTYWILWKIGKGKDIENYETFVYGLLMGLTLKG